MDKSPSFSGLMLPVIDVIRGAGGSATNEQIVSELLKKGFEAGTSLKNGGRSELEYKAAWAKSYLKAYGCLENPSRGLWKVTAKGISIKQADVPTIVSVVVNESQKKSRERKIKQQKPIGKRRHIRTKPRVESVSLINQIRTLLMMSDNGILSESETEGALIKLIEVYNGKA